MPIRVENADFEKQSDQEAFENEIDEVCADLEKLHKKSFNSKVMRKLVKDMIKVEEEVDQYDFEIRAIIAKDGVHAVPPQLNGVRQSQSARLARLRDQLEINVGKIKRSKNYIKGEQDEDIPTAMISHRRGKSTDFEP